MLSARRRAAVGAFLLAFLAMGVDSAAAEGTPGGGVECPPQKLDCNINADDPGKPGDNKPVGSSTSDNGSGTASCTLLGKEVPCTRDDIGVFNPADRCYWKALNPQPGPTDPIWTFAGGVPADWKPGDPGKLYNVVCTAGGALSGGTFFSATDPGGGGVDVQALAQEAVKKLRLEGADIGIAPKAGSKGGSVGLPVWVWNNPAPSRTGPTSASASAGGVTVTATASVKTVDWDFGNGTTVSCAFPGTPYSASYGLQVPDQGQQQCGFAGYEKAGDYQVAATTTWSIHWDGAGQTGDLTTTRAAQTSVHIGEIQVVGN